MPSSKRARVVQTSKVRKDRKELVRRLAANIQTAANEYSYIWAFDVQNMRNNSMKEVRSEFADSRLFMGKTKVMTVALGRDAETECVPGVCALAPHITREVGLLFTNREPAQIQQYFESFVSSDFARSGATAPYDCKIPPGECHTMYGVEGGADDPLPMSIEPTLRKLGMPTKLVKGKIFLEESAEGMDDEEGYMICKEGDTLDSRQTTLLKIFGVRMAEFKMDLKAMYDKSNSHVSQVGAMDVDGVAT